MDRWKIATAAVFAASLPCGTVGASAEEMKAMTTIGNNVLRQVTGAAMVNQAAGDAILQSNSAVVALNPVGRAVGRSVVVQRNGIAEDAGDRDATFDAVALISGQAFADARGVVSVTQGAGRNNLQINMITAALGVEGEVVVEAVLGQSRADPPPSEPVEVEGARFAGITAGGFRDAQGLIQVNQVAGQRNSTFNSFAIGVSAGAAP